MILPTYDQLKAMAKDEAALDRFLYGIATNPPRQSPLRFLRSWRQRRHKVSS